MVPIARPLASTTTSAGGAPAGRPAARRRLNATWRRRGQSSSTSDCALLQRNPLILGQPEAAHQSPGRARRRPRPPTARARPAQRRARPGTCRSSRDTSSTASSARAALSRRPGRAGSPPRSRVGLGQSWRRRDRQRPARPSAPWLSPFRRAARPSASAPATTPHPSRAPPGPRLAHQRDRPDRAPARPDQAADASNPASMIHYIGPVQQAAQELGGRVSRASPALGRCDTIFWPCAWPNLRPDRQQQRPGRIWQQHRVERQAVAQLDMEDQRHQQRVERPGHEEPAWIDHRPPTARGRCSLGCPSSVYPSIRCPSSARARNPAIPPNRITSQSPSPSSSRSQTSSGGGIQIARRARISSKYSSAKNFSASPQAFARKRPGIGQDRGAAARQRQPLALRPVAAQSVELAA